MAKRKAKKKADPSEADEPSKHEAGLYTLRRDRDHEFRRTITYESGDSAQLVFQPGTDIDLSQEEVDFLENEITSGMLVPTNRDEKGRQRVVREVTPEATATIDKLERQVEELAAENAGLKTQLENLQSQKA